MAHDIKSVCMPEICRDSLYKLILRTYLQGLLRAWVFIKTSKKKTLFLFIKNEKHSKSNYIPVSLLSIFGKIFKRLLYNNLFSFFIENDLISQNQSAIIHKIFETNSSFHV